MNTFGTLHYDTQNGFCQKVLKMFPAREVIRLEDIPDKKVLENIPPSEQIEVLPSLRIMGIIRQAECLSSFAMDIFRDVFDSAEQMFNRIENLKERTNNLENTLQASIDAFKKEVDATWPAEPSLSDQEVGELPPSQFAMTQTCIVKHIVETTNKTVDLTPFNELAAKNQKSEAPDYNKYFSNPELFKLNYIRDIYAQIQKEREEKKRVYKELKKKAKEEKKKNQRIKQTKDNKENDPYISITSVTTPAPVALMVPPPPGQAKNGPIPYSLMFSKKSNEDHHQNETNEPQHVAVHEPQNHVEPKQIKEEKTVQKEEVTETAGAPPPPPPPPPSAPVPSNPFAGIKKSSKPLPQEEEKSYIDLIKEGGFKLKKVDPNSPKPPPLLQEPKSHLDLIKNGEFKLKKVDASTPLPAKPVKKFEDVDPDTLTLEEILQHAATIRDAVAMSSSSTSSSAEDTSTTSW